jgi:hypothetical protein
MNSSKLILKEVKQNHEYLEKRDKELAQIKVISGQVKGMTLAMAEETKKQGEHLSIKKYLIYRCS